MVTKSRSLVTIPSCYGAAASGWYWPLGHSPQRTPPRKKKKRLWLSKPFWDLILVGKWLDWDVHWGYDFDFDPWPNGALHHFLT